jgi:hypothetical protein
MTTAPALPTIEEVERAGRLCGEAYAAFERIKWGVEAYAASHEDAPLAGTPDIPAPTLEDIGALWVLGDIVALYVGQFSEGARDLTTLTRRIDGARVERALRADIAEAAA